mmetsp:Transcript_67316/g.119020  ORF Transcript_67316/g.119020 Transcript_67316/m.119020 type:complete len:260 (-) Transcript_67316:1440-2219(-)
MRLFSMLTFPSTRPPCGSSESRSPSAVTCSLALLSEASRSSSVSTSSMRARRAETFAGADQLRQISARRSRLSQAAIRCSSKARLASSTCRYLGGLLAALGSSPVVAIGSSCGTVCLEGKRELSFEDMAGGSVTKPEASDSRLEVASELRLRFSLATGSGTMASFSRVSLSRSTPTAPWRSRQRVPGGCRVKPSPLLLCPSGSSSACEVGDSASSSWTAPGRIAACSDATLRESTSISAMIRSLSGGPTNSALDCLRLP